MSDIDNLRDLRANISNIKNYDSLATNMTAVGLESNLSNLISINSIPNSSTIRINNGDSYITSNWYSSVPVRYVKYNLFLAAYIRSKLKEVISEYMNRNHNIEVYYEK